MVTYILNNSRGEQVSLNNWDNDLLGYTPTGLGVNFGNTYSQYGNYFKNTSAKVTQGQMAINILFGQVESQSYTTFSAFGSFLNYQPLTLTYSTPAGSWQRDARVLSVGKSEIGGGNFATDRLNESFTLEFINPWYKNTHGTYRTYTVDSNLAVFGKGFFNELINANRNLVLHGSGANASDSSRPTVIGGTPSVSNAAVTYMSDGIKLGYTGTGTQEWYYAIAEAYADISNSVLHFDEAYTISAEVMGTAPAVAFRADDVFSPITQINNTTWTKVTWSFNLAQMSNQINKFYIRINASNGTDTNSTGFTVGMSLKIRNVKLEEGNTATPYISAPEDGVTDMGIPYAFGYIGTEADTTGNQPYADQAQVDITSIE